MGKHRVLISFIVIIIHGYVQAQGSFIVVSDDTQDPLIGATAKLESANGVQEQLVSNLDGQFKTELAFPITAIIRYLGYQKLEITVHHSGQIVSMVPTNQMLEEVVVTGQFSPQSARNSVYKVRSISSERIASQNANSIQDLLSNELNIQISRDNAVGRSGIQLQGLGGQNVKVLVDGIPMVGKGGVDNDIDLAQIDIQSIERIEIVEGPMAVNYGADALAGVINIITKKDIRGKMEANLVLQSETAGEEYSITDQGIHSPSLTLGYRWNDNLYTQLSGRIYKFGGWQGNSEGREKDWHPKEQLFGGFMTRYGRENWEIYYRLDVMDETITNLGAIRILDNKEPRATDEEYQAFRHMHQLQSDLVLGQASLNSVISYTDYERFAVNYERFLESGAEQQLEAGNDTTEYRSFFTRNTINNLFKTSKSSFQIGVESTHEMANGSKLSDGKKHLNDVAFFMSSEFIINKLKVRPGVRYSYNSLFTTIPTPSINFAVRIDDNTQVRWSYGRGFRAPSIRELFHEFIDSNHNLVGNPDLKPEKSHNFNVDLTHTLAQIPLSIEVGAYYNEIDGRISITIPSDGGQQSYGNISEFKSTGVNLRLRYKASNWNASLGTSLIGRYQQLREQEGVPDFIFTPEVNARIQYTLNPVGIQLSTFYKFNGAVNGFTISDDELVETTQESFHMLDANLSKRFFDAVQLSIGARNILNVTTINASGSGGVHGGGSAVPVGFGRSYFLRINYQIKK